MLIRRRARLLPLILPIILSFLAESARAERGCLEDPAVSGRTCSAEKCIELQADVNQICKNPAPRSCAKITGCRALRQERQHWLDCYVARTKINATCWSGGDLGHQERAASAIKHVYLCENEMAKPEPVGCGDPCP